MVLTAHIALVWSLRYFPTQDGPSHLYNLAILQDLLNGGKDWGNYFYYELRALPNLGFHLVAYPLLKLFSPLVTEKLFVSLNIILFSVAVPVLLRTFEKPLFPASFLLFPAVFSFCLMMGFYSFTIAIPLFLLATAVAWKIRKCSFLYRMTILNLMGFALYFFHLIPFVFYLISLVLIPLSEDRVLKEKLGRTFAQLILASPVIIALLLYVSHGNQTSSQDFSYLFSVERNLGLFADLLTFSSITYSKMHLLPSFLVIIILVKGLIGFVQYVKSYEFQSGNKYLVAFGIAMTVIYLVMPFRFGDGSFFNHRFPLVIYLLILPLLHFEATSSSRKGLFLFVIPAVFLSFLINAFMLTNECRKIAVYMSLQNIKLPPGSYLCSYKQFSPDNKRIDSLLHASCYYALLNKCIDVGNYEAYYDLFPVHFRKDAAILPSADEVTYQPYYIDWSRYPAINYIIGWDMNKSDKERLFATYSLVTNMDNLTIWEKKLL